MNVDDDKKELCGICEQEKSRGIHLYTLFICCECEQKMIQTDPKEAEYQYYLKKLKNMNQPTLN
ncbi:sigma factor G inhibitor Gin [Terrihalobacillus insolitus]|uniref:sigma factor G inhibitor Gin n=1 Tax=Terrihalobacillus insolitus TaxID=2950438 RepID=UPI0023409D4F|nr:sigma factor G inhibitor Gin [Terrihalobacillus insolitus]MDC3414892.1 sigma factor G inhibitor Gin [Terrihalobacillus insolitus]